MWLWNANGDAVLNAMFEAHIEDSQVLCENAHVNKNTMTKVLKSGLVKKEVLKKIADVLNVEWQSLQVGHAWIPTGPQRKVQKTADDLSDLIMDLLTAFARLVAHRTAHDPDAIRCLAYLFDEEDSHLGRLGAFTGARAFDDRASRIPCSRSIAQDGEEEWYIISRAFSRKQYVCDNVDWEKARRLGYRTAGGIWGDLCGVAACPIRPRESEAEPVGVVCVDSAKAVEQARWAGNQSLQSTLESLGGILYVMVAESDYLKRRKRRAP